MAAALTDLFRKLGGASSLVNTPRVTSTRAAAGATLAVDNCNWDQTTAKYFATYQVNTSGTVVSGTEIIWNGIVTGTTSIGSLTRIAGATDTGSAIGDYVELLPTSAWANALIQGLLVQHNQDGTHAAVTATSVASTGSVSGTTGVFSSDVSDNATTLKTIRTEYQFDFVASGLVWSGDAYASTRAASMTSGVVYINGQRGAVGAVTARTFTASKDTYVDILNTAGVFTVVYTEVTNNAASPALAANSLRIGIIVTGASNIAAATSVNQGQETMVLPIASSIPYAVTDSLGNLICPRDPNRKILGYRQIISQFSSASATAVQITGLTVPVIIPTGRKAKVTLGNRVIYNTTANSFAQVGLWQGTVGSGTQIGETAVKDIAGSAGGPGPITSLYTNSGSLTFNASINTVLGGTAFIQAGAAASPASVLVELV